MKYCNVRYERGNLWVMHKATADYMAVSYLARHDYVGNG